jgi:hypothetical protein
MNDWSERNMSQAGKDILIKSVAQALPTYIMGVFKLPLALCGGVQRVVEGRHIGVLGKQ